MPVAWTTRLTRQELADALGMSYDALRRNEKRLGLDRCKVSVNARVFYFREDLVVKTLLRRGFLVSIPLA
jgi:hypothetical protein